jgi:hypothetical protein
MKRGIRYLCVPTHAKNYMCTRENKSQNGNRPVGPGPNVSPGRTGAPGSFAAGVGKGWDIDSQSPSAGGAAPEDAWSTAPPAFPNLVSFPALPGWADVWYGPGTWLTKQTGHMVDTFSSQREASKRGDGLESEQGSGSTKEVCAGV